MFKRKHLRTIINLTFALVIGLSLFGPSLFYIAQGFPEIDNFGITAIILVSSTLLASVILLMSIELSIELFRLFERFYKSLVKAPEEPLFKLKPLKRIAHKTAGQISETNEVGRLSS